MNKTLHVIVCHESLLARQLNPLGSRQRLRELIQQRPSYRLQRATLPICIRHNATTLILAAGVRVNVDGALTIGPSHRAVHPDALRGGLTRSIGVEGEVYQHLCPQTARAGLKTESVTHITPAVAVTAVNVTAVKCQRRSSRLRQAPAPLHNTTQSCHPT